MRARSGAGLGDPDALCIPLARRWLARISRCPGALDRRRIDAEVRCIDEEQGHPATHRDGAAREKWAGAAAT